MRALPADAESLELYGQHLGAEGAAVLAQLLPSWRALKRLNVGRTQLGDAGLTALAAALRGNTSVVQLLVHNNGIGAAGVAALAATLRDSACIKQVELGANPAIGYNGAVQFFRTLGSNPESALALLSLHGAGIDGGAAGGGELAQALRSCRTLQRLTLNGNALGDATLVAMAAALPPALATLGVNETGATDAAALAFAAALQRDGCPLATLELGSNAIALPGARALARALGRSATAQSLYIAHNNELRIRDLDAIVHELPRDGTVAVKFDALNMWGAHDAALDLVGAARKRLTL
jgi:hypothetical protein